MNQNQQRYAINRVNEVATQKRNEASKKVTTKTKAPSDATKLRAVRDGDVELKLGRFPAGLDTKLRDAFDFRCLANEESRDEVKYLEECEKIKAQADKIKDEIMLGDEAKALKLICEFCG